MINDKNPIRSVDGVPVKTPSGYRWKLQDVSSDAAGRTEDYTMDKMRQGQTIGLELKWTNVSIEDAATILQAFNPEYVDICYLDALRGLWRTATFYVGDRAAPLYNAALGVWSEISFNVVERGITTVEGDESSLV